MYGTRDLGNAHMELLKERVFHRKRSGKVEIHIMIHEDLLKNLSVSLFIGLFFWFVYFYFFKILLRFREKGREGEREGEKHGHVRDTSFSCLLHAFHWGPGPQPRRVP